MASVTLPNLGIAAGFLTGENGWTAKMNRNLRVLDALINLRVEDRDATSPPSATPGHVYIVGPSATGDWAGHDGKLAIWCDGDDLSPAEWAFVAPKNGWRAYVIDEDAFYQVVGSAWVLDESSSVTPTSFSTTFGDGSAANFFIAHNLGTRNVRAEVYRNASPWESIICDVSRPNTTLVELSGFSVAPSADEFIVHISK